MSFVHHVDRKDFVLEVKTYRRLIVNDFIDIEETREEMRASRRNGAKKLLTTKKRFSQQ